MPKLGTKLGLRHRGLFGRLPPFFANLLGWYKPVLDTDFLESIANNDALFLPRVADFNGSDDLSIKTVSDYLGSAASGSIKVYIKVVNGEQLTVFSTSNNSVTTQYFAVYIDVSRKPTIAARDSVAVINNIIVANDAISEGWHEVEFISTGSAYQIKVDGIVVDITITGLDDGKWIGDVGNKTNIVFGALVRTTISYTIGQIAWVKIDNGTNGEWHLTGQAFEYDLSPLENHLTVSGSGGHYDYDADGSTYAARHGYSLWEHATSDPIQVDFDLTGSPISLTAGVNIPADYTHTRDIDPSVSKWNMADALVGFNEAGSADAVFEIFDRQNATRQTADSRASIYYDSTSLATRCRYHVTEIADPTIYSDFFHVDYKGKWFSKIVTVLNGLVYDIIREDEGLSYATDKTGADEWEVMKYCNIDVFALLDENDEPILDGDDYVIIV